MAAPGGQGMNNLTTLIKRLEAATSRLEDIASSASTFDSASPNAVPTGSTATKASASAPELAIVTPSISQQTVKPEAPPLPISIQDMDTLIDTDVKAFIDSSKGLDPLVEEQAAAVAKGFADQRRFLLVTTKAKRPDQSSQTFMDLLKDLQQDLGTAGDIKDSNRGAPVKEHLAMVAEGISTLQWLVLEGKPADTVGEMIGGAQMYGNRVLKNYKEGDQAHVKFVRSYYALLNALKDYIKKHYPMGVTWNASGVDAAQAMREIDAGPTTNGTSAAAGGPPPPPPPPPLPNFDNMPAPPPPPPGAAPKAAAGGDMGAVFDQLNRGESVTKGLKKVDPSQMTHKNPELRAASVVPGEDISRSRSPGPQIKPKPQSMRQNSTNLTPTPPKKEPKKELDGNKWLIENFDSPSQPITIDVSLSQSILITACKNTTIILKGKANAISIDNSPRLQILVETLVSSVDVIKSPNFAIQITGAVPTILLDQVDGASLYLSKESLACEVFTSKCSSVNLVLPPESEEADDSKECPLPEQIRTYIKGGKLVSEIVEHAG
ncbi:unnamed protein product [Zymoseptoria tritici ST99CH_3D7]|uniref:Adenylyl cyclase-associated protein n=1 Tax=Zymoseptoria tritici (strain ST99CH_3D7) TaxID=1276538 RepID=A0A1X7S4V0_ZYMT9|nr:unnamed protein product [Zymoseptoria tritici ST99CH_3D7]